jgi:hypothetical protein
MRTRMKDEDDQGELEDMHEHQQHQHLLLQALADTSNNVRAVTVFLASPPNLTLLSSLPTSVRHCLEVSATPEL